MTMSSVFAGRDPISDKHVLDELQLKIGSEKLSRLIQCFSDQLRTGFPAPPVGPETRDQFAKDAHAIGGAASLLGFAALSRACRAVEAAGPDLAKMNDELSKAQSVRDLTLQAIASR